MKILSASVASHSQEEFKSWLIFVQDRPEHLKALNEPVHADNMGLCLLKVADDEAIKLYNITVDRSIKNTVLIYRGRKVRAKFVNWTPKDAHKLQAAIDATCAK